MFPRTSVRRLFPSRAQGFACGLSLAALSLVVVAKALAADGPKAPTAPPAGDPSVQAMWTDHVEPILSRNCFRCHGGEKQKGGLDLRSFASILAGGTDGLVVSPGRPVESPLFQRIQPDSDEHMPPDKGHQLSAEEIAFVRQWIELLPIPGHPAPGSGKGVNWSQAAPSLMALASAAKWSPPTGMSGSDAIDSLIEAKWRAEGVAGSGACDDATFVRRLYVDLAGRIPTLDEADAFMYSTDKQKRAALVDRLLNSAEYPRRMAELFDAVLLERKGPAAEAERKAHGWFSYLEHAFATNRPWNQVVADLIVARPDSTENHGAVWFLYEKKNNYQQMAEAVAPMAFGVSINCAQCHNHPLAHEIKQQNYWGLVAAFNRSTNADTDAGPALSESAIGGFVNFTNLKKESQPAIIALLNDKTIDEKRPAEGAKEDDPDANYLVAPPPGKDRRHPRQAAVPKFSRRQAVAEEITRGNPLLSRALVNRIWAMLLGRGLVSPVDQMDSRHLPSHPELLAWLAQDFEEHDYDIKVLIRAVVLSRTYQLQAFTGGQAPPAPELFACALEKPLTAEQLYRSLLTATGNSEEGADPLRQALIAKFPALFETEYNATLQQAVFLSNSPLVDRLLKPNGKNLTSRLLELATSEGRVRRMFLVVLGRSPEQDELTQACAYLDNRKDRGEAALRHVEWALLASPEFLLNH
jgi:uncharacterized protein DUF1549/uncharacterized protein DUF1553/cytochrome c